MLIPLNFDSDVLTHSGEFAHSLFESLEGDSQHFYLDSSFIVGCYRGSCKCWDNELENYSKWGTCTYLLINNSGFEEIPVIQSPEEIAELLNNG